MRVADHTVRKSTPLTTTNHNNIERRHWAAKGVLRGCEFAEESADAREERESSLPLPRAEGDDGRYIPPYECGKAAGVVAQHSRSGQVPGAVSDGWQLLGPATYRVRRRTWGCERGDPEPLRGGGQRGKRD